MTRDYIKYEIWHRWGMEDNDWNNRWDIRWDDIWDICDRKTDNIWDKITDDIWYREIYTKERSW